jgi:hypothetical protein
MHFNPSWHLLSLSNIFGFFFYCVFAVLGTKPKDSCLHTFEDSYPVFSILENILCYFFHLPFHNLQA